MAICGNLVVIFWRLGNSEVGLIKDKTDSFLFVNLAIGKIFIIY